MKKILLALSLLIAFTSSAREATFNLATYNIRLPHTDDDERGDSTVRRMPIVASLARYHGFDIFGTQEGHTWQLDTICSRMPGYTYIGVGRDDGDKAGEHSAIIYNTGLFELVDHGDFWLSETPEKVSMGWDAACVRICTWGHFRHKPTGREFLYFNLHMDHVGTVARVESAKLIKRKIDSLGTKLPTFLSGDFNVDQFSPSYATVTEGGTLVDSHDVADTVYELNGTFNNFKPNSYSDKRIDHIFVSPDIKVKRYGILTDSYRTVEADGSIRTRMPSDHFPVAITVSL